MFDPYDPTDEFASDGGEDIEYPSVEDIYTIHDAVSERDEELADGVVNEGQIEHAIGYIKHGHFGEKPTGLFEKAACLFRLIIEGHEFVDGNKRTAVYSTQNFLERNGYEMNLTSDVLTLSVEIASGEDIDIQEIEEVLRDASTDT
jgi:death-on-curing protein